MSGLNVKFFTAVPYLAFFLLLSNLAFASESPEQIVSVL